MNPSNAQSHNHTFYPPLFHGFLKCPRCVNLSQVSAKFRRGVQVFQWVTALGDLSSALLDQFGSQFVAAQSFLDRSSAKGLLAQARHADPISSQRPFVSRRSQTAMPTTAKPEAC